MSQNEALFQGLSLLISVVGVIIAYFVFRNELRKTLELSLHNKMEDLKSMITIENRVGNLEKTTAIDHDWHKEEFASINKKLDANNEKLDALAKEFMYHIKEHHR